MQETQVWVRDENSNNGTFVGGQRLGPGQWTPVPHGGNLRFGPDEFVIRLE
jgi:pSer/pThr/pTyr-binding forkhead associated (FHA) protein